MEKKSLMGIGLFQLQVLHLISIGKRETVETIEKHITEGNLVEYLYNKYREDFGIFSMKTYDNAALNLYFQNYSGYIEGNEIRKYGIVNDEDGFLLVLALISDKVELAAGRWLIDA